MNTIKTTVWLGILLWIAASCSKDLGNYDYKDINDLEISGIETEYNAVVGEHIQIIPQLHFRHDPDAVEDNYTYEWISFNHRLNDPEKRKIISTSRNLNTVLPLPPDNYEIFYRVTEKATGIQWLSSPFRLSITASEIKDGWLILNDINGEARLDMLAWVNSQSSFKAYPDVLTLTGSDIELTGKPVLVYFLMNTDILAAGNTSTQRIYVGTDEGTWSINSGFNSTSFSNYRNLRREVFRPVPENYHAKRFWSQGYTNYKTYLLDSEGRFLFEIGGATRYAYGVSLNTLSTTGEVLNLSPLGAIRYSTNTLVTQSLVMYDKDKRRFVVHYGTGTSLFPLTTSSTSEVPVEEFDATNVGKDLLYIECIPPASNPAYVAVLKDPNSDKHYFLRFSRSATATSLSVTKYQEIIGAPDIARGEQFAVDPEYGYLFYRAGSKIYQYDFSNQQTKLMLDLGNRKITLMKFHKPVYNLRAATVLPYAGRYQEYYKKLMVCSYDDNAPETSGKMELYNVPISNGDLSIYQSFDGFGKIVDVTYREVQQ